MFVYLLCGVRLICSIMWFVVLMVAFGLTAVVVYDCAFWVVRLVVGIFVADLFVIVMLSFV